ncbi:hypothetical protein BpHYR1_028932 [Brachionus plicatilis]|uniref:Uncharacterized protein n=1 Tax=Brachionus plicatilis TaxID=10195 RepID=A0A3M7Q4X9_BRAPC|nr:hypothetical protein BpHYR1_028932 [Brachionus plicatilis]
MFLNELNSLKLKKYCPNTSFLLIRLYNVYFQVRLQEQLLELFFLILFCYYIIKNLTFSLIEFVNHVIGPDFVLCYNKRVVILKSQTIYIAKRKISQKFKLLPQSSIEKEFSNFEAIRHFLLFLYECVRIEA